jgi:hypothetical protein
MKSEIDTIGRTEFNALLKRTEFKQHGKGISNQWIEKLINSFHQGQYCFKQDKKLESAGFSIVLRTNDLKKIKSYPVDIENLHHQDDGDTLFEAALFVFGKQEKRIARRHREALKSLCQEMNLRSVMLAAPLLNYSRYAELLSVRDYLNRVQGKEIYDPLLSYQLKGFHVRRMLKNSVKPKTIYVLMEWNNIYFEPRD